MAAESAQRRPQKTLQKPARRTTLQPHERMVNAMTTNKPDAVAALSALAKPAQFCVRRGFRAATLASVAFVLSCGGNPAMESLPAPAPASTRLKDLFRDDFRIGTAVSPRQFDERDSTDVAIITRHYNTISPENVLKWEVVHPRPGVYDFAPFGSLRRVR